VTWSRSWTGSPDWERVKAMKDPPKKNITLRIDPEIIDWFKSKGKGYQTRMNAVLRAYLEMQHKPHRKAS